MMSKDKKQEKKTMTLLSIAVILGVVVCSTCILAIRPGDIRFMMLFFICLIGMIGVYMAMHTIRTMKRYDSLYKVYCEMDRKGFLTWLSSRLHGCSQEVEISRPDTDNIDLVVQDGEVHRYAVKVIKQKQTLGIGTMRKVVTGMYSYNCEKAVIYADGIVTRRSAIYARKYNVKVYGMRKMLRIPKDKIRL